MTAAAIALDEEILTPEQEIYRAEKARRAGRVRPEMVAAAEALRRLDEAAVLAGKGGRPKGSGMTIGKAGRPRGRRAEPEPEAPGRPEWLTPPTPPRESGPLPTLARRQPTTPSTPMPKPKGGWTKQCKRSGVEFKANGPAAKYCGTCDECVAAGAASAAKPPKRKPKAEQPEKRRTPVRTGFKGEPPRSKRDAKEVSLADAIASVEGKLAELDARRERLAEILESLREADAA
jgi:hypothetical protein